MTHPHEGVYARLGVSAIHGIGVFAIRLIAEGTRIFSDDEAEIAWLDQSQIDGLGLDDEQKKFYRDFCIIKDGRYGCPLNFNRLTIGWYLNEPPAGNTANVVSDENYVFFAARNIDQGEELTVDYLSFSEPRGYLPSR